MKVQSDSTSLASRAKLALIMDEEDIIVLSSDSESGSTGSLIFTPTKRPPSPVQSPVQSPVDSGDER